MFELTRVFQVVAFLVLGGLFLLIECVVPGFSVPGTLGLVLLGIACYLAFQLHLLAGAATVLGSAALLIFLVRYFPRTRLWQRLYLRATQQKTSGYHTGSVPDVQAGAVGEASTALRPSGTARIGGRRVDVVTEGAFIEAGARIVVVQTDGMRVVVRAQREGG